METRRSSNDFLPGAVAQWRVRWTILGEQVVCKSCGATQARHHCQKPFAHHKGCATALDAHQLPFRDLAAALRASTCRR